MIKLPTTPLRDLLRKAAAFSGGGTLPITSCVLLTAADGKLTIETTNLDAHAIFRLPEVNGAIEAAVPVKSLIDALGAAGDEVKLESKANALHVHSNGLRARYPTLPAADFPRLSHDSKPWIEVGGGLNRMISRVIKSAAVKDIRYYLQGVLLTRGKGRISAIATDGHRMSICSRADEGEPFEVILPRETLQAIIGTEIQGAQVQPGRALFEFTDGEVITKVIDGKFPDWTRLVYNLPDVPGITCSRAELARAVAATGAVQQEKVRGLKIAATGGKLTVSATGIQQDTVEYSIDCSGEVEETGFQATYIRQLAEDATGDEIRLRFMEQLQNRLDVIEEADGETWHSIVMPFRV